MANVVADSEADEIHDDEVLVSGMVEKRARIAVRTWSGVAAIRDASIGYRCRLYRSCAQYFQLRLTISLSLSYSHNARTHNSNHT